MRASGYDRNACRLGKRKPPVISRGSEGEHMVRKTEPKDQAAEEAWAT